MDFSKYNYSTAELEHIYKALVTSRLIEEKMLKLLRQGQVSKWFSGIGQEAISVGASLALEEDEYILPLHRNLGVFTTRNIPFEKLLQQWQGSDDGFTKGRDRSFHFGTKQYHIAGMISHLGAMLSVADGIALAHKINGDQKVSLVFSGDGGTSEGEFHEALNLAAVWDLPVIFLIENNGYGLSTPSSEQFRCEKIADKGIGYGIEAKTIDGNNILEVYSELSQIAQSLRANPRPFLLECTTFRMRGHEEASGTKYVPQELLDQWAEKDPILQFELYLTKYKLLTMSILEDIKSKISQNINSIVRTHMDIGSKKVDSATEVEDVFAQFNKPLVMPSQIKGTEMRFIDAISNAINQAMEYFPNLILMGQDIAEYGGVFKITDGLVYKYGKERVRNTPISEAAPIGAALGLSIKGYKSMVEMQFADFVSCGFNQIVNNLAKSHYRWAQNADVVIRMPTGAGAAAGPFHSQSNESWFFHVPGLKIVYPSTPSDAKGLLLRSFADPNPVLFFEHKALYRSIKEEVNTDYYELELGKAKTINKGDDLCFITYGWAVHWCLDLIDRLNLKATLVDLMSLSPWDKEAVKLATERCGKVLIVHEDNLTGGIGAEIAAWLAEHCFEYLDAPVRRLASLDTPIPFHPELEQNYLPLSKLEQAVAELMEY